MRSIRDIFNRMPETKEDLERKVMSYSPEVGKAIERNPSYRGKLEDIAERTFNKYEKYLGGLTSKLSGAGHVIGYGADAWLLKGDIIGSLGVKFLHVLAQIPQKAYSLVYGVRTGNYLDSFQNIFEGILSYVPGLTIVDQGLSRIVQKRMVKDATYSIERELGIRKSWYERLFDRIKDRYTNVKNRAKNIISPHRPEPDLAIA